MAADSIAEHGSRAGRQSCPRDGRRAGAGTRHRPRLRRRARPRRVPLPLVGRRRGERREGGTHVGLTKSLAREFARAGIRANCVSIALVQTDRFDAPAGGAPHEPITDERMKRIVAQYPLGRVGRADDVTPMVLLLASPRAGWITGQVVSVNGGYAML